MKWIFHERAVGRNRDRRVPQPPAQRRLQLVGLGQEMQTEKPKLLKKALEASDPAAALDVLSAIGVDVPKVAKQEGLDL